MLLLLLTPSLVGAQKQQSDAPPQSSSKAPTHGVYFANPAALDAALLLAPPPTPDSPTTHAELALIHRVEQTRTAQQIAAAQADDQEQDIFIFRDSLSQDFTADNLPLTAALSRHIHNDEGAVTKPLKTAFARPRPFQSDITLKPVCALNKEPNSYPSGHTVSGYLMAFALMQMVPEKQAQIMKRADDYAHNRIVCGVHYPSDIDAGRDIAYLMFGYMLADPQFQRELAAAREETRSRLGLPTAVSPS
jgi:acid phosphatase (class A)